MKKKKRILLYGGTGLVGSGLVSLLSNTHTVVAPTHEKVNLTQKEEVFKNINSQKPDIIIYASGFSNVDSAEKDSEAALLFNYQIPKNIAEFANELGISVCYFSTDAVFRGDQSGRPYKEDDVPNPFSVYGKSKLKAEEALLKSSDKNLIFRIIMPYVSHYSKKKDFARIIVDTLKSKSVFAGITDQYINPIYIPTLCDAVNTALENELFGIYHLGALDFVTNYEFALKVANIFSFDQNLISKISLKSFLNNRSSLRAKYCWLDTGKFRKEIGDGILNKIDDDLSLFKKSFVL